jgi:DnaJ-class molecular chaperone
MTGATRSTPQLLNHPDKNPDRIEEATKIFADLQQAYEVWCHQTDLDCWH